MAKTHTSHVFFSIISEHADGERRGAGADLTGPRSAPHRDGSDGCRSDPSQPLGHNYVVMAYVVMADATARIRRSPSAFAVGMLKKKKRQRRSGKDSQG